MKKLMLYKEETDLTGNTVWKNLLAGTPMLTKQSMRPKYLARILLEDYTPESEELHPLRIRIERDNVVFHTCIMKLQLDYLNVAGRSKWMN